MLNQVILVGEIDTIRFSDYGRNKVKLKIETMERPIDVFFESDHLVQSMKDYIEVGATIGIKASLDVTTRQTIEVIAEKVTFIKSSKT